jgi:hypothetical protein
MVTFFYQNSRDDINIKNLTPIFVRPHPVAVLGEVYIMRPIYDKIYPRKVEYSKKVQGFQGIPGLFLLRKTKKSSMKLEVL